MTGILRDVIRDGRLGRLYQIKVRKKVYIHVCPRRNCAKQRCVPVCKTYDKENAEDEIMSLLLFGLFYEFRKDRK
jgi:hypothetical protein